MFKTKLEWLFLNALTFVFTLCIAMKVCVANIEALNQSLEFVMILIQKLQEFKQRMMVQVVRILMPSLAFLTVYNHSNPQHVGDHV